MSHGELFRKADEALRRELESELLRSSLGAVAEAVAGRGLAGGLRRLADVLRTRQLLWLVEGRLRAQIQAIERYAMFRNQRWLRDWLRGLGPAGTLLEAMAGGRGGVLSTIQLAVEFLRAMGFEVLPPPGAPITPSERQRAIEAARRFLEDNAHVAELAQPQVETTTGRARDVEESLNRSSPASDHVQVVLPGGVRTFPADHPLVTGEMVPVISSNVHSIGYDLQTQTLYVRFLAHSRDRDYSFPASLYGYRHVRPDEFLDFLDASSPGNWVWDHLRVRGTVSGHKKDYFLAGIVGGYVPRKASMAWVRHRKTGKPYLAEVFRPRTVFVGGQYLTSRRPMEVVQVMKVVRPPGPGMQHLVGR